MEISTRDLIFIIGSKQVEIEGLRGEVQKLKALIAELEQVNAALTQKGEASGDRTA